MSNITLTGTAYYAWTRTPNQPPKGKSWQPKYKMVLVPNADSLARATELGMKINTPHKDSKVPADFLNCVKNSLDKEGNKQFGPDVVDSQLNTMTDLIGDGSTVNVKLFFNPESEMQNPRMEAIQVLDLIPVSGGGFEAVDGYTASPAKKVEVTETESIVEVIEAEDDYDEDEDEGLL